MEHDGDRALADEGPAPRAAVDEGLARLPDDVLFVHLTPFLSIADVARLRLLSRAHKAIFASEGLWGRLAILWTGEDRPRANRRQSPMQYFSAVFRRRSVRLRGCVSVYNRAYACVIEEAIFSNDGVALRFCVRGDGSLGALQEPGTSTLYASAQPAAVAAPVVAAAQQMAALALALQPAAQQQPAAPLAPQQVLQAQQALQAQPQPPVPNAPQFMQHVMQMQHLPQPPQQPFAPLLFFPFPGQPPAPPAAQAPHQVALQIIGSPLRIDIEAREGDAAGAQMVAGTMHFGAALVPGLQLSFTYGVRGGGYARASLLELSPAFIAAHRLGHFAWARKRA